MPQQEKSSNQTIMQPSKLGPFNRIKGYIFAKQCEWQRHQHTHPSDRGESRLNLPREFPLYRANMDGSYVNKAQISIQSIRNTIPFLAQLAESVGHRPIHASALSTIFNEENRERAGELKRCFDRHGSDKSSLHNYHLFYASILQQPKTIAQILEIGIGSTNPLIPSNMGVDGKPGASLRAWRDFCAHAEIFGADIDERVLFQDHRIQTFFLNQTDPASFQTFGEQVPKKFDLIIDDGLHAVDANIQTLIFALPRLKASGWLVIEDIAVAAEPLWHVVAAFVPDTFECHYIKAKNGCLFAVQRRQ